MAQLSRLFTWRTAIAESSLPPTQRHVALTLSLWMNEMGGSAWPSVATLAKATGLSDRAVQGALSGLKTAGWLAISRGGMKPRIVDPEGHTTRASSYHATIPEGEPAAPSRGPEGEPAAPSRVNVVPVEGEPAAPEIVITTPNTTPEVLSPPRASQREMFGAIVEACGLDPATAPLYQSKVGGVAKRLREVGAVVEDVPRFAADYRAHWPGIDLTPTAMLNHWPAWRGGQFTPAQPKLQTIDQLMVATRREIDDAAERTRSPRGGDPFGGELPERSSAGDDDR